jgi:CRP/FNR family transcriptional regulator, dissimilatory nitrate respiration regulator
MRRQVSTQALLSRLQLFEGLRDEELARLAAAATRRPLRRGDVLFRQHQPPAGLYALIYGGVKLTLRAPHGRERLVDLVEPGKSFGEAVLFLDRPNLVTATASCDSLVLQVPKEVVLAELARNPVFARRVIGNLAHRVEGLVRELQSYRTDSGAQRFVAWLVRRPGVADARGEASVTLPAAKAAIAAQLKLSPEHLSRILRELAVKRLVAVRGRQLRIPDVGTLRGFLSTDQGSAGSFERPALPRVH